MSKFINGIKWYYYLVENSNKKESLFSIHPRNTLKNKFIVCWYYPKNNEDKSTKLYTVFNDYIDFAIFFLKIDKSLRSFYEIVLGESLQKPHFDLDMELDEKQVYEKLDQKVLENMCNEIVNILLERGIKLDLEKDLCIYSSHGKISKKNGKYKRSYHIVIDNYCHANNKEAKAFYYKIMERLPQEYSDEKWIDFSVYSKTQQFRTYGSTKVGEDRIKEIVLKWSLNGKIIIHKCEEKAEDEKHQFLLYFEQSIVQARSSNCKMLPIFQKKEEGNNENKKNNSNMKYESNDIDYQLGMDALNLLANKFGQSLYNEKFPYQFDKVEGPFVILKRVKPSNCRLCRRVHHNQNPYLWVTNEKNVYFHCRRAPPEKKLYIGCLKKEDELNEELNEDGDKEEEKDKDEMLNWREEKAAQLRELASKSNPNKSKNKKKNKEESYNPNLVLSAMMKDK